MKRIDTVFSEPETYLYDPYLIAEIGVNHEGSMDLAKRLVDEAKEGGADAVKFQSYRAGTLASKDSPAYWDTSKEPTRSQFELFSKHDKFWKTEFEALKQYCDDVDIEFMSTPFDIESSIFLNDLMSVFKISSSDITNKPFITHLASFDKPIILSTGASRIDEVERAKSWIDETGNKLSLLHCVLSYPTTDADANLQMITDLRKKFPDTIIGYSDHTLPGEMLVLEVATLLGAIIIEKHFTHDKTLLGNDHYHAMDMNDIKVFKNNMLKRRPFLGTLAKEPLPCEAKAVRHARRSLVASRDIQKGEIIEARDLTWKRPASGICPSEIENVIGKAVVRDIKTDQILLHQDIGMDCDK